MKLQVPDVPRMAPQVSPLELAEVHGVLGPEPGVSVFVGLCGDPTVVPQRPAEAFPTPGLAGGLHGA
jgi:hypothetical protein